jgi:hypothetical protein
MTTRSPFGTEFATFKLGQAPDLDPTFAALSGQETVLQAVLRSWFTPPNTAVRGEGEDIRSYCQMRTSATNRARCRDRLIRQAQRDERVARAEVAVEPTTNGLRIIGRIFPRAGKAFRLVVSATELTARLEALSPIET